MERLGAESRNLNSKAFKITRAEVVILKTGCRVGIGVVTEDYDTYCFPGEKKESVGYTDDGGIHLNGEYKRTKGFAHLLRSHSSTIQQFECSVIVDGNLSEWFPVKSGVRQGCIISPILFLLTIDWIMRTTTADRPRGIQWTLFSQLEDLDFADDLAALSTNRHHLQEKTDRLNRFAKQAGLQINTSKSKVMYINATPDVLITTDGEPLDFVEEFTYLGSLVAKDSAARKDIKARLGKARGAFARLQPVWRSKQYSLRTKLRLYNSIVKPVLLYGAECWRVVKSDMNKINAFHNGCLRRICRIFWPNKISNEELYKKTKSQSVVLEIKRRRFRWLGHVLRMDQDRIPKTALRWTPPGIKEVYDLLVNALDIFESFL
ncbi:hypothetical protein ACROYT_G040141 [Oculina patagonica]